MTDAATDGATDGARTNPTDRPGAGRRRRTTLIVVGILFSALVGGSLYAALSTSSIGDEPPLVEATHAPAPSFTLPDMLAPNRSFSLADYRGKDLVVNFWASWCIPCRTEMPLLQSAHLSEHGAVRFLGIDSNDTRSAALAFLGQVHVTYRTLFDPDGGVASSYGLIGLPTTVFISASGKMLGRHMGQLDASTLKAALDEAFGDP
jgi:cytochrome c biogenesis protein CcmG/thiol:disulfide interchange protein DsbE